MCYTSTSSHHRARAHTHTNTHTTHNSQTHRTKHTVTAHTHSHTHSHTQNKLTVCMGVCVRVLPHLARLRHNISDISDPREHLSECVMFVYVCVCVVSCLSVRRRLADTRARVHARTPTVTHSASTSALPRPCLQPHISQYAIMLQLALNQHPQPHAVVTLHARARARTHTHTKRLLTQTYTQTPVSLACCPSHHPFLP